MHIKPNAPHPIIPALAGALGLAIALGIGRFGFTAAAPSMLREGVIGPGMASVCVTAHFAGYLVGALALARLDSRKSVAIAVASLLASVILAWAPSVATGPWFLGTVRFLSGVASGVAMVSISTWLFTLQGIRWAPVLYGGVGLGVALVAESSAALTASGHGACETWFMMAAIATVLIVPAAGWMLETRHQEAAPAERRALPDLGPECLLAVYAAGGFGYVVSATYLPTIVADGIPGLDPLHLFALFGVAVVPSCWAWLRLDGMFGTRHTLAANLTLQAIGAALPLVSRHPLALVASTLLVGCTFMGVVALSMSAGRRMAKPGSNLMALLTAAYAFGQLCGPLAATMILSSGGSLDRPLAAAGLVLLAGAVVAGAPRRGYFQAKSARGSLRGALRGAIEGAARGYAGR